MAVTLGTLRIKKAANPEPVVDASDQSENPEWQQPSASSASKKQRIRNWLWTLPTNRESRFQSSAMIPINLSLNCLLLS
jgi:hypothetical protein